MASVPIQPPLDSSPQTPADTAKILPFPGKPFKRSVAFMQPGGGAVGAGAAGAQSELLESPAFLNAHIVGSSSASAGSINAVVGLSPLHLPDPNLTEREKRLIGATNTRDFWKDNTVRNFRKDLGRNAWEVAQNLLASRFNLLAVPLGLTYGQYASNFLRQLLEQYVTQVENFSSNGPDCRIGTSRCIMPGIYQPALHRMHDTADKADLIKLILASGALPGVFGPQLLQDNYYHADGACSKNPHEGPLTEFPNVTDVIWLMTTPDPRTSPKPHSIFDAINFFAGIQCAWRSFYECQERDAKRGVTHHALTCTDKWYSGAAKVLPTKAQTGKLWEIGRKAAQDFLKDVWIPSSRKAAPA